MPSVVFDLDGTLADTSGDLLEAANACFRDMGFGDILLHPQDAGIALRGGRMMLTEGLKRVDAFSSEKVDAYYPVLLEAYAKDIATQTRLYDGAMACVEALKEAGYAVGICTNKPEALARQLLSELGILDDFDALIGADTLPVRKPDPEPLRETVRRMGRDPERTCLIGDSQTDYDTARAAGVPIVLVDFPMTRDSVAHLIPNAKIAHFDDLLETVNALNL